MPKIEFNREWENETAMVKRKDLAKIFAQEIALAVESARRCHDKNLAAMVQELLLRFSSSIMDEVFGDSKRQEDDV